MRHSQETSYNSVILGEAKNLTPSLQTEAFNQSKEGIEEKVKEQQRISKYDIALSSQKRGRDYREGATPPLFSNSPFPL